MWEKKLPDAGDVVVTARLFVLPGRWRERIKHSSDVSHVWARESARTECESLKAQPDIFFKYSHCTLSTEQRRGSISISAQPTDASVGEDRNAVRGSGATAAAYTLESYVDQY